jgi:alanine racemase
VSRVIERLRQRLLGRIQMNQGTADIHPDPQVRHDSEVRVGVYKLVLSDLAAARALKKR